MELKKKVYDIIIDATEEQIEAFNYSSALMVKHGLSKEEADNIIFKTILKFADVRVSFRLKSS
jgi:hypothetical protein